MGWKANELNRGRASGFRCGGEEKEYDKVMLCSVKETNPLYLAQNREFHQPILTVLLNQ